ncbi:MAG: hypothetical protein OHK0056_16360 [Bacteriovoracaceae bacterium]
MLLQTIIFATMFLIAPRAGASCDGTSSPSQSKPEQISMTVWNTKQSSGLLTDAFYNLNIFDDLYLFQEVDKTGLDKFSHEYESSQLRNSILHNKLKFGVASYSRFETCEAYSIDIADEPIMPSVDKGLVVQKFKFIDSNGHQHILKVINAHLPLFLRTMNYGQGAYKNGLLKISKEIENHSGPIIITGDFNGWTPNRTRYLLPDFVKKNNLQELSFRTNFGNRAAYLQLDRFYFKGLKIEKEETIASIEESDHFIRRIIIKF